MLTTILVGLTCFLLGLACGGAAVLALAFVVIGDPEAGGGGGNRKRTPSTVGRRVFRETLRPERETLQ